MRTFARLLSHLATHALFLALVLVSASFSACSLGGSALLEPQDGGSIKVVGDGFTGADIGEVSDAQAASEVDCFRGSAEKLTIVPPSGVRARLRLETCDGERLKGFDPSWVTVLEDDAPVDPDESGLEVHLETPYVKVTVAVLLDLSGSIAGGGTLATVEALAASLSDALAGSLVGESAGYVEVGLFALATRDRPLQRIQDFTACRETLGGALAPPGLDAWLPLDSATDLYGSVVEISTLLRSRREKGLDLDAQRTVLVIVSDGVDTIGSTSPGLAHAAIRSLDAGYLLRVSERVELQDLAPLSPSGTPVDPDDWSSLVGAVGEQVEQWQRERPFHLMLGYCSPRGSGGHGISLAIDNNGAEEGEAVVVMSTLRFNANGFSGGCDAGEVANPCAWGQAGGAACGTKGGVLCGLCEASNACAACTDEGHCLVD